MYIKCVYMYIKYVLEILDYCTIIVGFKEYLIECDSE
jgi:hypothetical protein